MKIVITGGLGYIGTELCRLYSKESDKKEIIVVDDRFVSTNVVELKKQGIRFIQGAILDKESISEIVKDADIIYHLAGITDVAYTSTESDKEKDRLIDRVAIEGSKNVIDAMKKDAKIIFPSTHVVFEGFKEPVFDIKEDETPCPVLTYSKGKYATEKYLREGDKNYIITRLASSYGLGGCTMRIKIMPNLFAKITSQNGTIRLFGGGVQYKSVVHVRDVARCMKYLAEKKEISRETFHVTNENLTVKEVAELCKEINSKVQLVPTDDEVPNKGYTMSNKKLLSTGFQLKHNLRDGLREMIESWKST